MRNTLNCHDVIKISWSLLHPKATPPKKKKTVQATPSYPTQSGSNWSHLPAKLLGRCDLIHAEDLLRSTAVDVATKFTLLLWESFFFSVGGKASTNKTHTPVPFTCEWRNVWCGKGTKTLVAGRQAHTLTHVNAANRKRFLEGTLSFTRVPLFSPSFFF